MESVKTPIRLVTWDLGQRVAYFIVPFISERIPCEVRLLNQGIVVYPHDIGGRVGIVLYCGRPYNMEDVMGVLGQSFGIAGQHRLDYISRHASLCANGLPCSVHLSSGDVYLRDVGAFGGYVGNILEHIGGGALLARTHNDWIKLRVLDVDASNTEESLFWLGIWDNMYPNGFGVDEV